jgi:hypothetical protein
MRGSLLAPILVSATVCVALAQLPAPPQSAKGQAGVFPAQSHPYGASYTQWSERWWQWLLAQPVEGHPSVDSPDFDVASGQSGHVWFLAAPSGTVERSCTIPVGTSLFVTVIASEWSDLEGFPTEQDQRDIAVDFADHMRNFYCTLDGVPVSNLADYRFESSQFSFSAPSPWIFGDIGGEGTAVADGYYVCLHPLPVGTHVLRFGGEVHYSIADGDAFDYEASIDMTYNLTVAP